MPMDELRFAEHDFDGNVYRPTSKRIISILKNSESSLLKQNTELLTKVNRLEGLINNNPFMILEKRIQVIEDDLSQINGKNYKE